MNKTTRAIATAAVASIAISIPLAAASAFADDHGRGKGNDNSGNSSHSSGFVSARITMSQAQFTAISGARKAYLTTVAPINQTLRSEVVKIQGDLLAAMSAPSVALAIGEDAYQFAKDTNTDTVAAKAARDQAAAAFTAALTTAKAAAQAQLNTTRATAQTLLDKAKSDYKVAVTATFPAGTAIAPSLLNPPRTKFNWMHGDDNWNSMINNNGLSLGRFKS